MKNTFISLVWLVFLLGGYTFLNAQTYVKSDACMICHPDHYTNWVASGHPYKFSIVEDNQPPIYPLEAVNFQSEWIDSLGDGSHTWEDVAGVIGGYGWKTRFVGTDGHLIGSANSEFSMGVGHNQINFYGGENLGWADYHPNDEKIYNYGCFKCHTTGGVQEGTWLPGVEGLGTFSEGGVGCEGCHGPGSEHIMAPTATNIDKVYEQAHLDNGLGGLEIDGVVQFPDPEGNDINFMCGTCHNRSYTDPINSSGGFVRHHEQWDEFVATKHFEVGFSCSNCHDPHKRTIWNGDGIKTSCETCHSSQAALVNHNNSVSCIDCHMPYAAKSGAKRGDSGFKGDVRSHLMLINTSTASMFTEDGSVVKDDNDRKAALSPHFSCLGCHNDDPDDAIPDMTAEQASMEAAGMHMVTSISEQLAKEITLEVHPNPAATTDEITFKTTLTNAEEITLQVFSISGQLVYSTANEFKPAGDHELKWNAESNFGVDVGPGIYLVYVRGNDIQATQKFVLTQ